MGSPGPHGGEGNPRPRHPCATAVGVPKPPPRPGAEHGERGDERCRQDRPERRARRRAERVDVGGTHGRRRPRLGDHAAGGHQARIAAVRTADPRGHPDHAVGAGGQGQGPHDPLRSDPAHRPRRSVREGGGKPLDDPCRRIVAGTFVADPHRVGDAVAAAGRGASIVDPHLQPGVRRRPPPLVRGPPLAEPTDDAGADHDQAQCDRHQSTSHGRLPDRLGAICPLWPRSIRHRPAGPAPWSASRPTSFRRAPSPRSVACR